MPTLRSRSSKGSSLSHAELDANFDRTVTQKTTTYQVLISDNRSIIEGNHASSAFTITLPAVATADNSETGDFEVTITNINAAIVTVATAGAETIDGASTLALQQWASATFLLDSAQTNWKTVAKCNVLNHIGALTVSGAFTSLGIDDNATGERMSLSDTGAAYGDGSAGETYSHLIAGVTSGLHIFSGDNSTATGGQVYLYGSTHGSAPGDVILRAGNSTFFHLDESAGTLVLSTGTGAKSTSLTLEADQDAAFAADVSCVALTETSDPKKKKKIKPLENTLAKVGALNGVEFEYKKTGKKGAGLLSTDVKVVLPEAVDVITETNPDGTTEDHEGVQYSAVVGLLVEAVKELTAKVELLESQG